MRKKYCDRAELSPTRETHLLRAPERAEAMLANLRDDLINSAFSNYRRNKTLSNLGATPLSIVAMTSSSATNTPARSLPVTSFYLFFFSFSTIFMGHFVGNLTICAQEKNMKGTSGLCFLT